MMGSLLEFDGLSRRFGSGTEMFEVSVPGVIVILESDDTRVDLLDALGGWSGVAGTSQVRMTSEDLDSFGEI